MNWTIQNEGTGMFKVTRATHDCGYQMVVTYGLKEVEYPCAKCQRQAWLKKLDEDTQEVRDKVYGRNQAT